MSYRVVIPTAGIGSRLGRLTKNLNKSLIDISLRPVISHLIEQFPEDCEFVIGLGYKGNLIKDFLVMAYPDKTFFFGYVDIYEGEGSGLGLTLLSCKEYLQRPFVFLSCDTLVKEAIPQPNHNWMGYAHRDDLSNYRTLRTNNDNVYEICEKNIVKDNQHAYIGLAGIYDYQIFWDSMLSGQSTAINQGESYGMKAILSSSSISPKKFTWYDTGNPEALGLARKHYSKKNTHNILEKENEAIWFVEDKVIKYSDSIDFIKNRVKRANELKGFVPNIYSHNKHMYCYKKVKGEVLSETINLTIFEDFLKKSKEFWIKKILDKDSSLNFQKKCLKFYKDKTFERINLFYENFDKKDNADIINGKQMPLLTNLLNKIDWTWISEGLAGRFHGDFHFENIIYSNQEKKFTFLDWRQDFAGDLSVGDIYYDFAKLLHGFIVNHGIITNNQYSASWNDNEINFDLDQKKILINCEQRFHEWIKENNYDLKKVKVLTGLIYLNIAALHHFPYSILLYGLGKKILNTELK